MVLQIFFPGALATRYLYHRSPDKDQRHSPRVLL